MLRCLAEGAREANIAEKARSSSSHGAPFAHQAAHPRSCGSPQGLLFANLSTQKEHLFLLGTKVPYRPAASGWSGVV